MSQFKYVCEQHNAVFPNKKTYKKHRNECANLLDFANMCTFVHETGMMCKKSYNHTSALLYHYQRRHGKYACDCCYDVFDTFKELDAHVHKVGLNLRKSKYILCRELF